MRLPSSRVVVALCGVLAVTTARAVHAQTVVVDATGSALYRSACAACHGVDGKGPPPTRKIEAPIPDFTNCSFSTREADADWTAVVHQGGPVRAFDETMPAFGEGLTFQQIQAIIDHIRTLCGDRRWPRGELNLPRSFHIEKAYPEDEAVSTLSAETKGSTAILNEVVYERRVGASAQLELKVPFGVLEQGSGSWGGGLGDVVLGFKQVLHHNFDEGSIFSIGAELQMPTGSENNGMGTGTWVAEPFLSFGKTLPRDAFVQMLAEAEIPWNEAHAESEAALGAVVGKTFTESNFGRSWTPMVELLVGREFESGAPLEWDIVPQLQVSLSKRQHVLANFGVRVPLSERSRSPRFLVYILWDWFDGGFFDGW